MDCKEELTKLKENQKEILDERKKEHEKFIIYKLDAETEQEKDKSNQFLESIKQIEQETNKYRNN